MKIFGHIETERWTCQRSGNSYIYIFEEGDVWGICYSGSVCNDACRKCRNYDCEMEGIVSSIDYVNGSLPKTTLIIDDERANNETPQHERIRHRGEHHH